MNILNFWGKAQPCDPEMGPEWHPLVFHCLDVAAVGEVLINRHHGLRTHLAHLMKLSEKDVRLIFRYLLCLHDVGKFAKKFQAKAPIHFPDCFKDDPRRLAHIYDHGAGGLRLYDADRASFNLPKNVRSDIWRMFTSAVTGHHGAPPAPRMNDTLLTLRSDFGKLGIEAAQEFIKQVHELLLPPMESLRIELDHVSPASFALAGLAVLTDWIGSNQKWFNYRNADEFENLKEYWNHALENAGRAVEDAGILPASIQKGRISYDALIGAKVSPSPMQSWTETVKLPKGPSLFMIEDETGSGKTEAALMLAHRLMAAGRADGLYIALPTMATANAMFNRLGEAYRKLFTPKSTPSIALAHGARDLHQGFQSSVLRGARKEDTYSGKVGQDEDSEVTASTACAAWIADDRRRTFLADVGAGTVDQALLTVLPSRHQSLRMLGLMRRVLILDEIHAYDAYMQREIETLLEFQAGLGGSAILLSATLPQVTRERLANAFSKGLGQDVDTAEIDRNSMEYPLATIRSDSVQTATKVMGQTGRARSLPVRFLRTPVEAIDEVKKAAASGKAVLYIRNTVDDALDAFTALKDCGLTPELFHARFALEDRLKKEDLVVKTFGKDSGDDKRDGKILVATQVVEQSLDLDFDALITDLAPIDLLIQRAGRLWRHDRPNRNWNPELLVVGPEPVENAGADWFGSVFPRAAYVYQDHARLWLTAKVLQNTGVIDSPDGLRSLIEMVYGDEADESIPSELKQIFYEAEGRAGAERGVATTNVLALKKGYVRDGGAWDIDIRTPTRLADDPQVTLRLACIRNGHIEPYGYSDPSVELWRAWRLSEVGVTARRISGESLPSELAHAAQAAKSSWTRFDADKILVILENTGQLEMTGIVLTGADSSDKTVKVTYSPDRGLNFG